MSQCCCFAKTLKLIDALQRCAEEKECDDFTCSKPFLGVPTSKKCFNTRPVTFYGCNNNPITVNFTSTVNCAETSGTSNVFRVEEVDDGCVLVLVLMPNPDTSDCDRPFVSTGNTATINLGCVCVLKCLRDTFVDL